MDDRDDTPARRPSSLRIQQWGIVQAWLCGAGRGITLLIDDGELVLVAIDPVNGNRREVIPPEEDPSKAALRAIGRMTSEPAA